MAPQRWTDEMLDRFAAENDRRMADFDRRMGQLLEAQQMLVQIYAQEHDARVESDRRFNRFMERTERFMERTDRFVEWAQQSLANHEERLNTLTHTMSTLTDVVNEIRRYIRFNLENGHGSNGSEGPEPSPDQGE